MDREKLIKILNLVCIVILIFTIPAAIYLASQGAGLTDGSYGPGAYYYSDIPGWEKIFFGEKAIRLGFDNPVIGYGFFVIQAFILFNILLWVDKRGDKVIKKDEKK